MVLGAGLGAASLAASAGSAEGQTPTAPPPPGSAAPFAASRNGPLDRPYNVILIITDEEAYHLRPAEGFTAPARAELQRRGTTFVNHYIGAGFVALHSTIACDTSCLISRRYQALLGPGACVIITVTSCSFGSTQKNVPA